MKRREMEQQDRGPSRPLLLIEEMEERLEAQAPHLLADGSGDELCVWYACADVCPPGG